MKSLYYSLTATAFGDVGIVWRQKGDTPSVVRIVLPGENEKTDNVVRQSFSDIMKRSHHNVEQLFVSIQKFLEGQEVSFSEGILDMSVCGEFQQEVLRQSMLIPRGKVSTYGRLAKRVGRPKSARAVGMALAANPFPLVIPCHRIIRADGDLCGFGGGLKMKKALLNMEGVVFNARDRVLPEFFW
jgi:methylated-DNA-[protein]-cysteine S-methyltransferase